jgi:DNA-binding response OmpR family regulator
VLSAGPLEIMAGERTALAEGNPLMLTERELQLLLALARSTSASATGSPPALYTIFTGRSHGGNRLATGR